MTVPAVAAPAPPLKQTWLLTSRLVIQQLRNPAVTLPNLFISIFFLFVYDGGLGAANGLERIIGGNYINFVLPVAVVSASLSGASSGLILVGDLESGYFRRLLSMPLSRWSIVVAPMLVGALQVVVQTVIIIVLGLVLGASPEAGVLGLATLIGLAFLWGLGFAGYSVAAGLKTGNAAAAQAATFLFFPLLFLTTTFLPKELLKGWMQAAATVNPTTYVLDGMRSLLIEGWEFDALGKALLAVVAFSALTLAWAFRVAKQATERA